jgi:hypothetical protein
MYGIQYTDDEASNWLLPERPGFDSRQGQEICSLRHSVQTGSGDHTASYPVGTGGSFPGSKVAEAWSWWLTSIWYRGQEWWSCTFTSAHVFMTWCLIKHMDNGILIVIISRPALGPIQTPLQWAHGLSMQLKLPGLEVDHSRLSSIEVNNA